FCDCGNSRGRGIGCSGSIMSANVLHRLRHVAVFLFAACLVSMASVQKTDPLPSWNEGPAKQAILQVVRGNTDRSNPEYVAPEDRIATFDQDGTTWVEHPMYTQVVFCLDRVPALVAQKPELRNVEPFKTVMSGDHAAIAKLTMPELEKILE